MQQLAAQGFGGFVGNVSFDGYLDDESKWPAFLRGAFTALRTGGRMILSFGGRGNAAQILEAFKQVVQQPRRVRL